MHLTTSGPDFANWHGGAHSQKHTRIAKPVEHSKFNGSSYTPVQFQRNSNANPLQSQLNSNACPRAPSTNLAI
eukprot:100491-Pyramimonas_sp.AAC.1